MQVNKLVIALSATTLAAIIPAFAQADDFINGSFESPNIGASTWQKVSGSDVTGWTYTNGGGALISNGFGGGGSSTTWHDTPAGNQYLYLGDSTADGVTLDQSVNLTAGAHTLYFLQADFASGFMSPGGAVNVAINNPDTSSLVAPTLFSVTPYSDFVQQSLQFTAPTAGSYDFQFISVGLHGGLIDGVSMDAPAPVPEPCSMVALGMGALAVVRRRRASRS